MLKLKAVTSKRKSLITNCAALWAIDFLLGLSFSGLDLMTPPNHFDHHRLLGVNNSFWFVPCVAKYFSRAALGFEVGRIIHPVLVPRSRYSPVFLVLQVTLYASLSGYLVRPSWLKESTLLPWLLLSPLQLKLSITHHCLLLRRLRRYLCGELICWKIRFLLSLVHWVESLPPITSALLRSPISLFGAELRDVRYSRFLVTNERKLCRCLSPIRLGFGAKLREWFPG